MNHINDEKFMPLKLSVKGKEVRPDVYYLSTRIVNLVMIGNPREDDWVLMDTGMPNSAKIIMEIISDRFPRNKRPSAIILTHGHFDHVGNIQELIQEWEIPVYAHPSEFVYLTGQQPYPKANVRIQGNLLTRISAMSSYKPINIATSLVPLPSDCTIPGMPGWRWIHTPGHSPGHVSFFRDDDRTLLAGDAFVTIRTDSFYKAIMEKEEINGPPPYFTNDWDAAWESVKKLEALRPALAVTGHGPAMEGEELRSGLEELVNEFDEIAIPKYVR